MMSCNSSQVINAADKYHTKRLVTEMDIDEVKQTGQNFYEVKFIPHSLIYFTIDFFLSKIERVDKISWNYCGMKN